jgi:ketosteroid isomerase-like protein
MSTNTDLVNRYYDAVNHSRWEEYGELFSADAELEAPGGVIGTGPAAMQAFDAVWRDGAPDFTVRVLHQSDDGTRVASENEALGIHTQTLHLPDGDVPATGAQIGGKYVGLFEIRDGRIVSQRVYFDRLTIAEQLGLLGAPA